jgi:hypothetical protein
MPLKNTGESIIDAALFAAVRLGQKQGGDLCRRDLELD